MRKLIVAREKTASASEASLASNGGHQTEVISGENFWRLQRQMVDSIRTLLCVGVFMNVKCTLNEKYKN
jgi:hypothetical protein